MADRLFYLTSSFLRSISVSCGGYLKHLNLSFCSLENEEICLLSSRLYSAGFCVLETLDISGNLVLSHTNAILISARELASLVFKLHESNGPHFKQLYLRSMDLKDEWLWCLRDVFEQIFFPSLTCVDISGNLTIEAAAASTSNQSKITSSTTLTHLSLIPFFEMMHFKFGWTFKSLRFSDMGVEANPRILQQLDHIVLKFSAISELLFSRDIRELKEEISRTTLAEFR